MLLILLVISIFINYIDRGNLSIAAPLLRTEAGLSPQEMGVLLSSFFWTYAALQLFGIAGWLANRFDVYQVFAVAFLLWSSATAVTGLVYGFPLLLLLRLVLGVGESLAYPVYSRILATEYAEHHRGVANALIDAGSKLGPALGTLLGGLLMARYGWRTFFVVLGVGSLVWLLPWYRYMPRDSKTSARALPGPSAKAILSRNEAWATFAGLFCANYFWFFLLTWLPSYLVMERHFSMDGMAQIGGISYFAIAIATTIAGSVADRWVRNGQDPIRVRKTFTSVGLMFSTVILPVCVVSDHVASISLLLVACMSYGIFTSSHWAITQTLAGPTGAAKWTGLQNGVGNLAGVAAPWLTGFIVKETGQFYWAFVLAAGVALIGACVYFFWVGRARPIHWDEEAVLP